METKTNISSGTFRDVYEEGDQFVTQNRIPFPGQTMRLEDGREFVFVSSDVDLAVNRLAGVGTAADAKLGDKVSAAAKFANKITIDTKAQAFYGGAAGVIAANTLTGGAIHISSGADRALFSIKSHTAGTALASVTFTIEGELPFAIAASNDSVIQGPLYKNVALGTGSLPTLGAVVSAVTAATAGKRQYFWLQTKGLGLVYINTGTSIVIGENMSADGSGGCRLTPDDIKPVLGTFAWTDASSANHIGVLLDI